MHDELDDDLLPLHVVVLHEDPTTGAVTSELGGPELDLNDDTLPQPVEDLLRGSTVCIDSAEDVPKDVLASLKARPVPALFRASVWLYEARPLLMRNRRTLVAGTPIGYDETTGLWVGSRN